MTFLEGRNQELFRVGEVSWHKGTSRNILFISHERKALLAEILEYFLLDTVKTAF